MSRSPNNFEAISSAGGLDNFLADECPRRPGANNFGSLRVYTSRYKAGASRLYAEEVSWRLVIAMPHINGKVSSMVKNLSLKLMVEQVRLRVFQATNTLLGDAEIVDLIASALKAGIIEFKNWIYLRGRSWMKLVRLVAERAAGVQRDSDGVMEPAPEPTFIGGAAADGWEDTDPIDRVVYSTSDFEEHWKRRTCEDVF